MLRSAHSILCSIPGVYLYLRQATHAFTMRSRCAALSSQAQSSDAEPRPQHIRHSIDIDLLLETASESRGASISGNGRAICRSPRTFAAIVLTAIETAALASAGGRRQGRTWTIRLAYVYSEPDRTLGKHMASAIIALAATGGPRGCNGRSLGPPRLSAGCLSEDTYWD